MTFSPSQLERYSRNILVSAIGGEGQQRLLAAKVLVVGAGGLGSPLLYYLAAAGVGTIGIVDHDTVALSNLQRQILYNTTQLGQLKTSSTASILHALNPDITVETHAVRLDESNAATLIAAYDVIADGSDNVETRQCVSHYAHHLQKPLVSAAIRGFEGQIATFKSYLTALPCYRCLYPNPPDNAELRCTASGVLGAVAGVVGSLQAVEVVKEILHQGESLAGSLLCYNGLTASFRKVKLTPDPHCQLCGEQ